MVTSIIRISECGDYDFLPSLIYIFNPGCWLVFLFCFQAGLDGWEERSHHSHLWLIINLAPVKACSLLGPGVGWLPHVNATRMPALSLSLRSVSSPAFNRASSSPPSLSSRAPTRDHWNMRPTHLISPARNHPDMEPPSSSPGPWIVFLASWNPHSPLPE